MKQLFIGVIFIILSAACRKPGLIEPDATSEERIWYVGVANVGSFDPYCPERPVSLFFSYSPIDGKLPIGWGWTYSLPDSLRVSKSKMRFLYSIATTEEIQICGLNEHPYQVIVKDIEIIK